MDVPQHYFSNIDAANCSSISLITSFLCHSSYCSKTFGNLKKISSTIVNDISKSNYTIELGMI